jgi:hypothetical protein
MSTPKTLIKKGDLIIDTLAEYGIFAIDFPVLLINARPKNIATISYYDEDGDYEFIPNKVKFEPQTFVVKFGYMGDNFGNNISSFIDFISNSYFTIYNSHAKTGRQKCRVLEISEPTLFFKNEDKEVVEFSVQIKSNDPINNITLSI